MNHRISYLIQLVGLLCSIALLATAQDAKVTGVVKDASGSPVTGATVNLLNARQSGVATAMTDAQGQFTLKGVAAGTYEVLVTAKGFAARRAAIQIPNDEKEALQIRLGVAPLTAEVTVTADVGTVQELDKTTQQVNVIDEDQLQQRATSVLAQAFREEPGVQLQRTSSTMSGIFVRGFTGAKVAVFVDGVRFSTSAARGGVNSFFNLNDASSLRAAEVQRGPNSAQFGSDSLGGSVQLVTRSPLYTNSGKYETHGQFGTHYHSADHSWGSNQLTTVGNDELAVLVNLSGHRSNTLRSGGGFDTHAAVTRFLGISSDVFGERSTDTAFTQYGGLFKLNFKLTPRDFLAVHYSRTQIDGGKRFDQTLGGDGNLLADLRNFKNDFFYGRYERVGALWFDSLALSYSFNAQREERVNQGGQGNPTGAISFQPERTEVHGFQTQAHQQREHNGLTVGGDFYYDLIRSKSFNLNPVTSVATIARGRVPDQPTYKNFGLYLQDIYDVLPGRLRLIGALRYNSVSYVSRSEYSPIVGNARLWPDDALTAQAVTPRFGAVVTLAEGLNVSTQVSRGFRAPHTTDLATVGLTGNGFEANAADLRGIAAEVGSSASSTAVSIGKPVAQLKPESSWSYEAGVHLHRSRVDIDFNGFINELRDNIAVQTLLLPQGSVGLQLGDQRVTSQLANGAVFLAASANPVLIRANFDDARIVGLEQKFDVRITNALTLSQNFTWLRARDKRTDLPPNIEGGTPAPQGNLRFRYQPTMSGAKSRWWVEPYVFGARRQSRLSTLDLDDRRTGATRTRAQIANFFARGAFARGLILAGNDGRFGTVDDLLRVTNETVAQVQNRVLGSAASAPLFRYIPGFMVVSVRGGVQLSDRSELTLNLENLLDKNYRGISWGMDAPGRGLGFRYQYRF